MILFDIPGAPCGKQRPRMTRGGHTYTPKQTVNYETWVKNCFIAKYNNFEPLEGDLIVAMKIYYPLLKSMSKKNKENALNGILRPSKKPDIDNICKAILDSLNNLAFVDDKQVVELKMEKWYSEYPRAEVLIGEL